MSVTGNPTTWPIKADPADSDYVTAIVNPSGNTAPLEIRIPVSSLRRALASQAEAEAGTNNVKGMTPLRVAQEIAALAGDMLISEYDTNDDGTVDASDKAARVEETVVTDTDSGAAHEFDLSAGTIFPLTLTASCALTFANVPSGGFGITMIFTQDATGSRTASFPAAWKFPGGTAPTLSSGPGQVDIITGVTPDGGTTWYGFVAGLDMQ